MDGVKVALLGHAGDAHLVFAGTTFGNHALVEVGLGVPNHVAKQFCELGAVLGFFKSVALESLSDFGIAFAVGLTAHGQVHSDFGGLAHEMGIQVLDHVFASAFGNADDVLGYEIQGRVFINDLPFNNLFALRAALRRFFSLVDIPANRADKFFLHEFLNDLMS